jgi:hypothetical protein
LTFKYKPLISQVDATNAVVYNNINTNVDSYYTSDWLAAMAWIDDAAYENVFTPFELVQAGGRWVNLGKPFVFTVRPKGGWRYAPIPANLVDITTLSQGDIRSAFCGALYLMWQNTAILPASRTGTNTGILTVNVGSMDVDWTVDFKYPMDPDTTQPSPKQMEEKKFAISHFVTAAAPRRVRENDNDDTKEDSPVVVSQGPLKIEVDAAVGVGKRAVSLNLKK